MRTTQSRPPACAQVDERDGEGQGEHQGPGPKLQGCGQEAGFHGRAQGAAFQVCLPLQGKDARTMPEEGMQGPGGSQGSCASVSQQAASKQVARLAPRAVCPEMTGLLLECFQHAETCDRSKGKKQRCVSFPTVKCNDRMH